MRLDRVVGSKWFAYGISIACALAAWIPTRLLPVFHPELAPFFLFAVALGSYFGGMGPGLLAAVSGLVGLHYMPGAPKVGISEELFRISWLLVAALIVGYVSDRRRAVIHKSVILDSDLATLKAEFASQKSDLARFQESCISLSGSLESASPLQQVVRAATELQQTTMGLLLLGSGETDTLSLGAHRGFTPEQIELFPSFPVTYLSLRHRMIVEDTEAPGKEFPFYKAADAAGFRALFSTPIVSGKGRALGVIVTFFKSPHRPTERETKFMDLYARQAANAMENAELYRNSQNSMQAEQRRAVLLRSLSEASVRINSTLALDSLLQVITDLAREIVGAHQAFTSLSPRGTWTTSINCVSLSQQYASLDLPELQRSEMFFLACSLNKPTRLTKESALIYPQWSAVSNGHAHDSSTLRGWLATPLITRDGRNLGLIQLSHKIDGEFTEEDESILVQLAHMASVAIENVRLYREAQEQITERSRAQEALQRSKESLHLAQRSVGIGVWEWDLQDGTLSWSDEIAALHGLEAGSFDGKYETWMNAIQPEDREQVHKSVARALAQNGEYEVEYRTPTADGGTRWLEARGQAFHSGNVPVRMLGVAMDVSSRKQAEEALRTSEKLAATGRLAASIAHEINNPLAAVTNLLYLLKTHPDMSDATRDYVVSAESELARVAHITRQTLAFYRDITHPVETYVGSVLDEALGMYARQIDQRAIKVVKNYEFNGAILAFKNELRQVFSNLVLNALEALPTGGTLKLHVLRTEVMTGKPGVRVAIADNGCGVDPEHKRRIFDPFFTTKGEKGTGLGLWVTEGIVKKHGGQVRVRSTIRSERSGTCFTVFLPFDGAGAAGSSNTSTEALSVAAA